MLQFAVVVKLLFITDFFNFKGEDWFTLNCCDSGIQIHEITDKNRDSESDRGC